MAALTTLELFASLVPQRMQILRSADGPEGHFQASFSNLWVCKNAKLRVYVGNPIHDLTLWTISEALVTAKRTNDVWRTPW